MCVFNKLVRDRIPEIIRSQGETPHVRTLAEDEYRVLLEQKLDEETAEFHESKSLEELADILEVVLALAEVQGCTGEELLALYNQKHEARGGFKDKILLISKE